MRKAMFVGLMAVGTMCSSIIASVPASAGSYCGSRYYGYGYGYGYGYYAPTTDSYWSYRRYSRPAFYYGASFYRPRVWGWRSWGGRPWRRW